jgi:alpha/beta superfamily hydrolase
MTLPGNVTFQGPAGRLEGIYKPAPEPARAAIVCHPLPTHGGTMHNKVVFRAAKAFERLGYSVLRFNFRGVGRSEGSFTGGPGESQDARAALEWVAGENPGLPLVMAGFSFGTVAGLPLGAEDDRVTHLVGIGVPERFPFRRLAGSGKPKLFVHGELDELAPLAALRAGLPGVAPPYDLVVIEGVDHFFAGKLAELERAIIEWFARGAGSDGRGASPDGLDALGPSA